MTETKNKRILARLKGVSVISLTLFFCLFLAISSAFCADTTPPSGSIKINNDAQYTISGYVTLNLSAQDSESTVSQMKFSNDNISWSTAYTYAKTKTWSLTSVNGIKTVYAMFKDSAGNWSSVYSDTIILDTVAPVITAYAPKDATSFYEGDAIILTQSATDLNTPIVYQFSIDAQIKSPWSEQASYTLSQNEATPGLHTLKLEAKDAAGKTNYKQVNIFILRKPIPAPN